MKKLFSSYPTLMFTAWVLACSTAGCRPAAVILPSHIRTVAVESVENRTSTYGLEALLTRSAVLQFQQDGRLAVSSPGQADLSVQIIVKKYLKECILTDTATNRPMQYRLSISYDLSAKDQVDKKTLSEAAGLAQSVLYYTPDFPGAITETEDQALSRLAEDLSRSVARRVIQGD